MTPQERAEMDLYMARAEVLRIKLSQAQAQIERDNELIKALVHEVTSMKSSKTLGKID